MSLLVCACVCMVRGRGLTERFLNTSSSENMFFWLYFLQQMYVYVEECTRV